jgi:hypothetical protein
VKGDGDAFDDFLEKNYPGKTNACLSRADYSNRQDWSLEAASEIFPLLEPLLDYEVKSLLCLPQHVLLCTASTQTVQALFKIV